MFERNWATLSRYITLLNILFEPRLEDKTTNDRVMVICKMLITSSNGKEFSFLRVSILDAWSLYTIYFYTLIVL